MYSVNNVSLINNEYEQNDDSSFIWDVLSLYLPPVIIFIGTFGNIFSFIIFIKLSQAFRQNICIKNKIKNKINDVKMWLYSHVSPVSVHVYTNKFTPKSKTTNEIFTIYFYLSILALFDLGVLYFGLLNDWMLEVFSTNIKNQSRFLCKSTTFLAFFSSHSSSLLLVVTNLIRLISIYSPLKATQITNLNRFKLSVLFSFFSYSY